MLSVALSAQGIPRKRVKGWRQSCAGNWLSTSCPGTRGQSFGTFLLQSLCPVLFLFILVPRESRGQEKLCPFPVLPEGLLRGISELNWVHWKLQSDFLTGRADLAPPNRPRPPNYPPPVCICACAVSLTSLPPWQTLALAEPLLSVPVASGTAVMGCEHSKVSYY